MIRRSKLKVRPAIRKSQFPSQGNTNSAPSTPTQTISNLKPVNKDKENATIVSELPPSLDVEADSNKLVYGMTEKSTDTTNSNEISGDVKKVANGNDEITDNSKPKTPAPTSRRRKLVACPMMAKKRQKTSTGEVKPKPLNEVKTAPLPPPDPVISTGILVESPAQSHPPNINTESNKLPHIENFLSPPSLLSKPCEINHIEVNDQTKEFVTLTPVTSNLNTNKFNNDGKCENVDNSSDINIASIDANVNSSNLNDTNTTLGSTSNIDASDQTAGKDSRILTPGDHDKLLKTDSQNDKKIVEYVSTLKKTEGKMKQRHFSATAKHRSNAFKKLKQLKEKQDDDNEWPEFDQNLVSMSDLIFLNPPNTVGLKLGMNVQQEQAREEMLAREHDQPSEPAAEQEKSNSEEKNDQEDAALPVPQIRIADDGSVVIDEDSLVLDTQKPVDPKISTVYEFGKESTINQCSFMRRPQVRTAKWSIQETDKFYKCLCVVGAEFSLMGAMFRERTSDDLRRKFKRERKKNPNRIDKALMQQHLSKWTDDMFEPKTALQVDDNSSTLNNNKPRAQETVK